MIDYKKTDMDEQSSITALIVLVVLITPIFVYALIKSF